MFTAVQPTNWEFRLKTSTAMDQFVHVSLFVTKALADKQEIIRRETWQDKNWLLLCCSWDLIRLPLTDINGWEEATQKNTYGCKKNWTSANKGCTTCTELWQLIKAHAPNVAVINYAEGSIVCFCLLLLLLLQIIERFKDVVGGESCGAFIFFPASSTFFSPLVSWLCLAFGVHLIHLPSWCATLCTIPLATRQWKPQTCASQNTSHARASRLCRVFWQYLATNLQWSDTGCPLSQGGSICKDVFETEIVISLAWEWADDQVREWVKWCEIFGPRRSLAAFRFSLKSWSTFCLKVWSCAWHLVLIKGTLWSFRPRVVLWSNVLMSRSLFCFVSCVHSCQWFQANVPRKLVMCQWKAGKNTEKC